jgi:hypothetical protein
MKFNQLHISLAILLALSLVTSFVVWYRYYLPQQNKHTNITLPVGQEGRITTEDAIFSTQIRELPETISITLPFKFETDPFPIWLDLKASDNFAFPVMTRLVHHPLLSSLNWPMLMNETLTLFQKQKTYDSIDAFIQNPPSKSKIYADSQLINRYQLSAENVDQVYSTSDADYILTTYKPPLTENGYLVYLTEYDAGNVHLTSDNLLSWHLRAPLATVSAYFVGQIFVDYK